VRYPLLSAAALAVGVVVIACGSDDAPTEGTPTAAPPETSAASASATTEYGRTLHYSSFGTKAAIDCGDRRPLDISGSNNLLTVTGTCASLTISGADNRVRVADVADTIDVTGLNNTVTYENGDPKISNTGTGNIVRRAQG
jgi:hypothetical protein